MITITPGPTIQAYSEKFGISIEEVTEWVSAYVNTPSPGQRPEYHAKDRKIAIGEYMREQIK
jgi:hypothetical protein